jgi:hypothetical protein
LLTKVTQAANLEELAGLLLAMPPLVTLAASSSTIAALSTVVRVR